jgi:predicted CDP-diglyceride synthetase/phosphatidate cytidylyltransferase
LVALTVLGLAWCAFAPVTWIGWIFTGVVINVGGAIGDLYVCWRIAREAEDVWVKDTGNGFQVYTRRVE